MENNPPPLEKARLERAVEEIAARRPLDAPEAAEAAADALAAHLEGEPPPDPARRVWDGAPGAVPSQSAPPA